MKNLLTVFFALLLSAPVFAQWQGGKVFDHLTMPSKILKSDRKYAIYLPPDYDYSDRTYPVLYLLHGALDDQTGWVQFGEVKYIADKAIAEGKATPMIIVVLDGNGGRRGFVNDIKGDWNFEDFFFKEMIPYIDQKFHTKKEKKFRAVAGLSMGGGATYIYALHHPEMFSAACPLSGDIGPATLDDARKTLTRNNPNVTDAAVDAYYKDQSVLSLVNNMPDAQKTAVRWYMSAGDQDGLSAGDALVHIAMLKKGVQHEFRIEGGGHNWTFWRAQLAVVLNFISESFHQP
jgi:enterochelin esterase-like enzyme